MSKDTGKHISYKDAGVNIDEGSRAVDAIKGMVQSTFRPECIGGLGGFAGLFSVRQLKKMTDPILVSGTDGVGTKLKLAQLAGVHDTVGIDLVAMCANDVLACGAEPLFFLDYIAVGKLNSKNIVSIVKGVTEGCKQAGCALIGGEMAEHPGVMDEDDYDLSGFCVGVIERSKMLGSKRVCEGDAVLGLASSGIHSNGFSLVRRAFSDSLSLSELQKPLDALGGKNRLDALLTPTRIYVPSIQALLETGLGVHALAHITGGGITENVSRVLPPHLDAHISPSSWKNIPIIDQVIAAAHLSRQEAFKTFNMGIGMCVVCAASDANAACRCLEEAGEEVFEIGTITAGHGKVVYIDE